MKVLGLLVVTSLLLPLPARADLIDLGDGTIYSTDLDIAFLKDMNSAMTMGFDSDGAMTWQQTLSWIGHLNTVAYLGYTDWQLTSGPGTSASGLTSPFGSGGVTIANYLEHLVYGELGNSRPVGGSSENVHLGPFENAGTTAPEYWIYPEPVDVADCRPGAAASCYAVSYNFWDDSYDGWPADHRFHASAMRRASVPEPATLLLLGVGVLGLLPRRRRSSIARR